jgi:hypothetical protein
LIFGVPAKEAAGFTLTNHVFQMVPVIIVGLVSSIITGAKIAQVVHHADDVEHGAMERGVQIGMNPAMDTDEVRGEYFEDA